MRDLYVILGKVGAREQSLQSVVLESGGDSSRGVVLCGRREEDGSFHPMRHYVLVG